MRVFGWSNAAGGVHHYRIREPLRGLAKRGHETKSLPAATSEVFEQWNVVVVRGLHHPKNSLLWQWAAETDRPALRVYDLDDDIWAWIPGSKEDEYWTDERRLAVELNIQAADLVTTPTHALAEVLSQLNPRIAVLPNTIPERLLQLQPEHRERFIIGWQGAAQHVRDLQLIYNPILRFMLRYSDVEFHAWGVQGTLDFPDALASRIITHPWVGSVWAHYYRLNMDIGLAPLDPNDTFNFTKSDIRLREYAALGIPFIASDSDAYTTTANAVRGMLASSEEEWEEALTKLYENPDLRAWMAEQGRLRARLWTTEANGIEWERAYDRASHARIYRNSTTERTSSRPISSTIISANGDGTRAIQNIRTGIL
jgi:glycosyltransferase involved in cell wall biosynthesis